MYSLLHRSDNVLLRVCRFDALVRDAVIANLPTATAGDMTPEDPEEWVCEFEAWTRTHADDNLPLLSVEAICREFINRERGL